MKLDPYLIPYTKINFKCSNDLSIKHETIKLLEENIGKNFLEVGLSNFKYDMKITGNKSKKDMWDCTKLKKLLNSKGNHQQIEKGNLWKGRKCLKTPWLVWFSGLNASLQTKELLVRFPVGAHAWVEGQVFSHSFSFPSPCLK